MVTKLEIAKDWLPRYTGMKVDDFGDYILLTNFHNYLVSFAEKFNVDVKGDGRPMQSATNSQGLSMINFGIGSAYPSKRRSEFWVSTLCIWHSSHQRSCESASPS